MPSITEQEKASANGAPGRLNLAAPTGGAWSGTYASKNKRTAWVHIWDPPSSFSTDITYDPRLGYSRHDVVCTRN